MIFSFFLALTTIKERFTLFVDEVVCGVLYICETIWLLEWLLSIRLLEFRFEIEELLGW